MTASVVHAPSWLDTTLVQRFDHLYDARPSAVMTLGQALDSIIDGTYAPLITHARHLFATRGEDAYASCKRRLPQYTFAGTFAPSRAKGHLQKHSGIVHADLDHLQDLTAVKLALIQDPHVVYCFTSPRADGLKFGTRIAPVDSDAAYQHAWQVLAEAHQRQYGIIWDASGKDVCRLCFVSWDPACYINPDAQPFPVPPPPAPRPTPVTMACHWPSPRLHTAAQRALERAVQMIVCSQPGAQHMARCRAAYLVGGYVAAGELSEGEALAALEVAVNATAQDTRKAMRDITDGLTAGLAKPITTPGRRGGDWHSRATAPKKEPSWRKC